MRGVTALGGTKAFSLKNILVVVLFTLSSAVLVKYIFFIFGCTSLHFILCDFVFCKSHILKSLVSSADANLTFQVTVPWASRTPSGPTRSTFFFVSVSRGSSSLAYFPSTQDSILSASTPAASSTAPSRSSPRYFYSTPLFTLTSSS